MGLISIIGGVLVLAAYVMMIYSHWKDNNYDVLLLSGCCVLLIGCFFINIIVGMGALIVMIYPMFTVCSDVIYDMKKRKAKKSLEKV
jgi:predicted membrane protein